ncbi:MAG: chromosome segregation protein SMC [Elusimicrobiota bacterium]|jgi:chromosome segregation protein|nr:chromosome segregation protein SMC [Elusimicrobiota bacterium]
MYLKKVEIIGFKSFADKTVLDFEKGITAIIGPNGCGKSNISDAIRWCLGEQRAKSMRSAHMQDVIFGGTQKRTVTGMAEVSLTFDNSQNVLPIDYSEVLVTRKLFRDGESEYSINKTQCRLKDIRDMFLDTGIGFDGYSIIEQGKVDFLTTAKPEDRRELFEEAAGVAKYKVRREETLRKLEKVENDMVRLSDALTLQKEQISLLDQQARKAKQYKKYQQELAKYEVADLVQQIAFGNEEIKKIKETLSPKTKDFEINNTMSAQIDAEIAQIRLDLDEKNARFVELNSELSEIKTQLSISDQIVQSSSQREEEIIIEQERLSLELGENEKKVSEYERELNVVNTDDTTLFVEVENLEKFFRQKESEYNQIQLKLAGFSAKVGELRLKLDEIESQKENQTNLKAQIAQSKVDADIENQSLKRIVARLESDILPITNEIISIEAEIGKSTEELLLNENNKEKIEAEIADNESKLNDFEKKLDEIKNNFSSNQARIETLKEFDKSDPIRLAIRDVVSLGFARGPFSALIDIDPQNEEIAALALGEKLNYLISKDIESAQRAIKFLEENNLPSLSFVIENRIPQAHNSSAFDLTDGSYELIKLLKFHSADENIIRFLCSDTIVSGKKIYSSFIISGGAKYVSEKPVLIEEQIKRLENKNNEISSNVDLLEKEIELLNEKQIELRSQKERLGFDTVKIKTQIENKKNQIEEKKFDITGYTEEINKNKTQIESQNAALDDLNAKISTAEIEIEKLSAISDGLNADLENSETEIINLRNLESSAAPQMMEARSAYDKKAGELENKKRGQEYIRENINNIRSQIESAKNRIAENELKLAELLTVRQTETDKIENLHEQRATKEADIQISLGQKDELQRFIDEKTETLYELRNKTEQFNAEINALQIDLKNFEFQKNNLSQKLEESCGKSYEEIKDDFNSVEVNREEITKIKRKMEALGAINHAAPEEYDALEQRYNFLLDQQKDLLKAKDDLHEVIKKINDSTIENFKKTFDMVRGNFQQLYRKLFGGQAEADLKLTDEKNLLESGIDIFAQPPGKKLQNISLFSGGEKALTAVALLFAFFMVKASPFCILDEVDAPLDDANIGKYNEMIKEFVKDTQFLIVTHNKKTMEIADILYGVTMEEQGVSKIISVKLNEKKAQ